MRQTMIRQPVLWATLMAWTILLTFCGGGCGLISVNYNSKLVDNEPAVALLWLGQGVVGVAVCGLFIVAGYVVVRATEAIMCPTKSQE